MDPPLHPSDTALLTKAIFAPVALMLSGVASMMSGVGKDTEPPAPGAPWINRYCPGWIVPDSGVSWVELKPKLPVPVALAYWIDQPASEIGMSVGLKIST